MGAPGVIAPWLRGVALGYCRSRPWLRPEVDDLVGDVVLACVAQQVPHDQPSAYVTGILRHKVVDLTRKRFGLQPSRTCADCGGPTWKQRCAPCARVARQPPARTCSSCPRPIGRRNRSGRLPGVPPARGRRVAQS